MYNLLSFDKYIYPYNHPCNQDIGHTHYQKVPIFSPSGQSLSTIGNYCSDVYFQRLILYQDSFTQCTFEIHPCYDMYPEKAMAPHSSTLAWKIPWTEEPGRLQSMGLLRVGHDWATSLSIFAFHFHALEKEMATHSSVLAWRIPETGEPGGLPSMGSHRVGHDWSDLAAAAGRFT